MLAYLLLGATYAFAASVQPGPFQAFLISLALEKGWRRALPAALSPLLSDGPVILVALIVLSHLPGAFDPILRCAGGVFLLYLALDAFKAWRRDQGTPPTDSPSAGKSILQAATVNLLNPSPYLGWSLVLGPLLLKGWRETPANGVALVVGFYLTMVLTLAGIITLFAAARSFGPLVRRHLLAASVIALACFGCFELWTGGTALLGG